MMRSSTILGLVALAMLAASVFATAAQAASFTSSAGSGILLFGSQVTKHTFTTEIGSVKCSTADLSGTTASVASETQTLNPTYGGCIIGGALSADVNMGGCDYLFHAAGRVDVACPWGGAITITVTNENGTVRCSITIPAQTSRGFLSYFNSGSGIEMSANVGGILYEIDGSGCGGVSEVTHLGSFTGSSYLSPQFGTFSVDTP